MEQRVFRSGELARLAGVSTDLLRHYERVGILPLPIRAANRYRRYPAQSLDRVRVVRCALSLGFSLRELAQIFAIADSGGIPCKRARALAGEKLRQVELGLAELRTLRRLLRRLLKDWDRRLASVPAGHRAGLLDSLKTPRLFTQIQVIAKKGFARP
jgi:DNA-binding transcriptional MerR regulator